MPILTTTEAANVLRTSENDAMMLDLLPQVDAYIRNATGRDWAGETPVHAAAKAAARMLLVMWYEDPGRMGSSGALTAGFTAALTQLEALAGYRYTVVGAAGVGYIAIPGVVAGDRVVSVRDADAVDLSADFETVISSAGYLRQTGGADYSDTWLHVLILPRGLG